MHHHRFPLLAPLALTLLLPLRSTGADADLIRADGQLLAGARLGSDGPALLALLRSRTLTAPQRERVQALIRQLGHKLYPVRSKASAELVRLGPAALALLRQVGNDADLEVKRRAEACVRLIEKNSDPALPAAAARLLAVKKPAGAAEVLLTYLPYADSSGVTEEVETALAAVAVRAGRPEPVLIKALTDPLPLKRAAAAEALCRGGAAGERDAVRKLLRDSEATVRLRAALALASAKDKTAVPVLIALLTELPAHQAWQPHDFLCRLAQETAPDVPLETDDGARKKCQAAWTAWWQRHGERIDLARLSETTRLRGYTLVVLLDTGQVLELGVDAKPRWRIGGLRAPLDAQVLPGRRVLITEHQAHRVSERNRKGEVLWEVKARNPVGAERLPNGNTFVVSRGHLFEVDRQGKEVFNFTRPNSTFVTARTFRDGRIAYISSGKCVILDRRGKELASFPVPGAFTTSCLDVLPNGHLLVAHYGRGKVVEYTLAGKAVWQAAVTSPIGAVRLANGNTLIAKQGLPQLIELNRRGQIVWNQDLAGHPTRARRR